MTVSVSFTHKSLSVDTVLAVCELNTDVLLTERPHSFNALPHDMEHEHADALLPQSFSDKRHDVRHKHVKRRPRSFNNLLQDSTNKAVEHFSICSWVCGRARPESSPRCARTSAQSDPRCDLVCGLENFTRSPFFFVMCGTGTSTICY